MKTHAPHPTQTAACGVNYQSYTAKSDEAFKALPTREQCKRCAKVLAAKAAGRPHYSGIETAAPK